MLCRRCHMHTDPAFPYCVRCGKARAGVDLGIALPAQLTPELDQHAHFALAPRCFTIGRHPSSDLVIEDGRVSRHHARVWREPDGYRLEDLDSANGTWVAGRLTRAATTALNEGDMLYVGTTGLRFEQPRAAGMAGRTEVHRAGGTMVVLNGIRVGDGNGELAADAAGPLSMRPLRHGDWKLKRQAAQAGGEERWILHVGQTGRYLELSDRDHFLWERLDGSHTVQDLLLAYHREYGTLALSRIQQLIGQLTAAGVLAGVPGGPVPEAPTGVRRAGRAVLHALLKLEVSVRGADRLVRSLYGAGAWRFFTLPGRLLLWALVVVGFVCFSVARSNQGLLDVGGAGTAGVVIAIAMYVLALNLHELAHALTVVSHGRRVARAGFMVMMAMPYAFVDTSDMWFETRRARISVALAGPFVTGALAGCFGIAALTVPGWFGAVAFQVAFGLYVNTLFNLNPLLPLDGYHAFVDAIGVPRLREQASAYVRRGLWSDLAHLRRPRLGLTLFGAMSLLSMTAALLIGVSVWRSRLGGFVNEHVPAPANVVILGLLLSLILIPMWYGPLMRITRLVRRGRPRPSAALEHAAA